MKKVLLIIIGALLVLLILVIAVLFGTKIWGFEPVAYFVLIIAAVDGFTFFKIFGKKKLPTYEILSNLGLGALCGSLIYLIFIFSAKSFVFSLLGGITGGITTN